MIYIQVIYFIYSFFSYEICLKYFFVVKLDIFILYIISESNNRLMINEQKIESKYGIICLPKRTYILFATLGNKTLRWFVLNSEI